MAARDRLWLDSASTTPLAPEVAEAMAPWLRAGAAGNPSSLHAEGRAARWAIEETRERLAALWGTRPAQVHFTGSATEANNLALAGSVAALPGAPPPRVVASATEHDSVRRCLAALAGRGAIHLVEIPARPDGRVDLEAAREAFAEGAALATLMHVNNETGVIQPLREWAAMARAANPAITLHCDAAQAPPRLPLELDSADLITISAHKVHGPPGVGALIRRRPVPLAPLIHGGPQEGGLRAGTESVAAIVGLGAAVALAHARLEEARRRLALLEEAFLAALRRHGVAHEITTGDAPRAPGLFSLHLPLIESADLVMAADLEGVALSAGSACQSGTPEPSHVLRAMGLDAQRMRRTVRIAFHREQTVAEAEEAAARIARILSRCGPSPG